MTRIKRTICFSGTLLMPGKTAWACAVCFGDAASPLTVGLNMGILSLLVILFVLMGFFVAFFINFRRRAQQVEGGI